MPKLDPKLQTFTFLAGLEGSTLLLLLTVAVPLKHLFAWPHLVQVLGPIHGLAFLAYLYALWRLYQEGRLDPARARLGALASLLPFGSWVFLRRQVRCIS